MYFNVILPSPTTIEITHQQKRTVTRKKDSFCDNLDRMHDAWTRIEIKIFVVDVKDKMGSEVLYRAIDGKYGAHVESNGNGIHLAGNVVISRTVFEHKDINNVIWLSSDGGTCDEVDHLLSNARLLSKLVNFRTYREAEISSYYCLITSKNIAGISNA
jgi:hypothetical protein